MAVLPPAVTSEKHSSSRERFLAQIDRLINARVLHGSESLCKLLRYLAAQALDHPGAPVKEYQIATEVFGRPADFDPQSDSAIRVQAGRLRSKLAEYYASDGQLDPITVEMPKGSYLLVFNEHPAPQVGGSLRVLSSAETEHPRPSRSNPWVAAFAIACILLVAAGVLIFDLARRPSVPAASATPAQSVPALATFWQKFGTGPEEPWVIFSNAAFVGRPETGMRYYNAVRDKNTRVWDHYTGVGEVLAVHSLDGAFRLLNKQLRVKRGSLFSLDDAGNRDLIFVGSPSENLTLRDIPNTQDFVFQRVTSGPRRGDLGIRNVRPRAGEESDYVASPSDQPLTQDYAVIAYFPGLNPARSVMILAGTTTFGTQAAVEFASHENTVKELLARLAVAPGYEVGPFEALLSVDIARGVPVESKLVAIRKR